ncbi:MAG TPA: diguanylate cyclase [Myxococcales bacterium]|nr:diguanylate cyclase [Myxococcales bacterium]
MDPELETAAQQFRLMVESVRDYALFLLDARGRIKTWNAGARLLKGYEAEEVLGKPHSLFYPPEERERSLELLDTAVQQGRASDEGWRVRKDGTRFWASVTLTALRDTGGELTGFLKVTRDLTEQRATQTALLRALGSVRRNEQVYRAIVQHLPNGGAMLADHSLRYVAADGPFVSELLRLGKLPTIVGRAVAEVAAEANRELAVKMFKSALRGEPQHAEVKRAGRWFALDVVPIREGDEIMYALSVFYDITERMRKAEELRRARELLEATLRKIEDGVVLLDGERRVVIFNETYAAMFGLSGERLAGLSRDAFVEHAMEMTDEPEDFRRRIEARSEHGAENFVLARPRRRVLRRTWMPMELPGGGDGFLVTWHDITAEQDLLLERERQSLVDALTGIANRRAAEKTLLLEHERMKRTGLPVSVALFDIDHFKRINDTLGHAGGDEVLRQVAATLSRVARMTDTVARWGGEEFVAVLPGKLQGARLFCERARAAIEALRWPRLDRVTISVGVAEIAEGGNPEATLCDADARLYEAKRAGRNQVKPAP